jgi:hypothetical protein
MRFSDRAGENTCLQRELGGRDAGHFLFHNVHLQLAGKVLAGFAHGAESELLDRVAPLDEATVVSRCAPRKEEKNSYDNGEE